MPTLQWQKPPILEPRRGHALWDRCRFAFAPEDRGINSNLNIPLREDAFGALGTFSGGTDASHFGVDTPGVWLSDGGSSNDVISWPSNARLNITRAISFMTCVRMKTLPASPYNSTVFGRGSPNFAVGNNSWELMRESTTGGTWLWQFNDGVANRSVTGTTLASLSRTDCVICTYDRVTSRIYVNGIEEGQAAYTSAVANVGPIGIATMASGGDNRQTYKVFALAMWDRLLTRSEVAELSADPFVMWRTGPVVVPTLGRSPAVPGFFLSF